MKIVIVVKSKLILHLKLAMNLTKFLMLFRINAMAPRYYY